MDGQQTETIVQLIRTTVRAVMDAGAATMSIDSATRDHGPVIHIRPLDPEASPITIHIESASQFDLHVGIRTHLEIYATEGRSAEAQEELIECIRAVVEGRFSEAVWHVGDEVVRSVGTFHVPERRQPIRAYTSTAFGAMFRRKQLSEIEFHPYL